MQTFISEDDFERIYQANIFLLYPCCKVLISYPNRLKQLLEHIKILFPECYYFKEEDTRGLLYRFNERIFKVGMYTWQT